MGLLQHLLTSVFGTAKRCPADASMSQVVQLQGCCSVGDPDLEGRRQPPLTATRSGAVRASPAGRPHGGTTARRRPLPSNPGYCGEERGLVREWVRSRERNDFNVILFFFSSKDMTGEANVFSVIFFPYTY